MSAGTRSTTMAITTIQRQENRPYYGRRRRRWSVAMVVYGLVLLLSSRVTVDAFLAPRRGHGGAFQKHQQLQGQGGGGVRRILASKTTRLCQQPRDDHDHDGISDKSSIRKEKQQAALPPFCSKLDRRQFVLQSITAPLLVFTTATTAPPAHASPRGLMLFPLTQPLVNKYHFMRAGPSLLEEQGLWSTNPLFMTNRDDALSEAGQAVVLQTVQQAALASPQNSPTVMYHSLAAKCCDTADLIGEQLKMGRDRIIPEYTYLDPRGVGLYDMTLQETTQPAIWALDVDQAGKMGTGARPPANSDGTPNETLQDQTVRLRQMISVLENRQSGDTVLLIFPDGTGPALLSAMMAGIPYSNVHELEYAAGEIRLNVTPESVRQQLAQVRANEDGQYDRYQAVIQQGRENLRQLQQAAAAAGRDADNNYSDNANLNLSLKDQKLEQERVALEAAMQEKKAAQELLRKEEQERLRQTRQEQLEAAKQARLEQQAAKQQALLERQQAVLQQQQKSRGQMRESSSSSNEDDDALQIPAAAWAAVGLAGAGAVLAAGGATSSDDDDDEISLLEASSNEAAAVTAATRAADDARGEAVLAAAAAAATANGGASSSSNTTPSSTVVGKVDVQSEADSATTTTSSRTTTPDSSDDAVRQLPGPATGSSSSLSSSAAPMSNGVSSEDDDNADDAGNDMSSPPPTTISGTATSASPSTAAAAEARVAAAPKTVNGDLFANLAAPAPADNNNVAAAAATGSSSSSSSSNESSPVVQDKMQAAQQAMEAYLDLDDGGDDWLRSIAEIRAEAENTTTKDGGMGGFQ